MTSAGIGVGLPDVVALGDAGSAGEPDGAADAGAVGRSDRPVRRVRRRAGAHAGGTQQRHQPEHDEQRANGREQGRDREPNRRSRASLHAARLPAPGVAATDGDRRPAYGSRR